MSPTAILRGIGVGVILVSMPVTSALSEGMRELSDTQLGLITAGAAAVSEFDELASFEFAKTTRSGRKIAVAGSFKLVERLDRATFGSLMLTDQAQRNLRSLVNINAVNSNVNVLLNLNINIDSSVGSLNQININRAVPAPWIRPGG